MRSEATEATATAFGVGALVGVLAAGAECLLVPLGSWLRVGFAVGVYGLAGGIFSLAAAGVVRPLRGPRGLPALVGVVAFLPLAAALGLLANRVVLRDVHHLEPVSLAADGLALVLAAGAAFGLAAGLRRGVRANARLARVPTRAAGVLALALAGGTLLPVTVADRGGADPSRPTVVLLSIDTLRPDRLGTGGFPEGTSPELDRLLRESVHFPEAFAVSPGSGASHAALVTSRYPISNGVDTNFSVLDDSVTTLAEILRARGYRTGGFVTNMFLGTRFGFPQGFDTYVQTGVVESLREPTPALLWRSLAVVPILDHLRHRLDPGYDPSLEAALRWVRASERPALLFVHLMDVHSPYVPSEVLAARFGATREGSRDWDGRANPYGWRRSDEAYHAEIHFADAKIGRLRRVLEALGRLDNAVVVVTSDHGENLADHAPHYSHGATLFDATLRVVFAVRAPGALRPRLDPQLVENVDLVPSLASLLDLPRDPAWEGRNLLDPALPEREATFAQIERDFAVRTRHAKWILHEDGRREVLALDADPAEKEPRTPVAGDLAEAEREFRVWYEAHVTDLYAREGGEVAPSELSPEDVSRLRTLGYLR